MKFNTILVDGDIYLHRACSVAAQNVDWGDGEIARTVNVEHAIAWVKGELKKLRVRLGAKDVVIALGDRKGNFRKELSPTYKAHRASPKPPGFLEVEADIVKHARVVREPRLEGDDMLGLALTRATGRVCVSIDKDLRQVPGWHYNPDQDALVEVSEDEGNLWHLLQTLTGDRVDGYPGCPGVGRVRAGRILAGDTDTAWERVVDAFEKAKQSEEQALLQARLAFVLRQGYFNRQTGEVKLWQPS